MIDNVKDLTNKELYKMYLLIKEYKEYLENMKNNLEKKEQGG